MLQLFTKTCYCSINVEKEKFELNEVEFNKGGLGIEIRR
jgi:hypothetical protein